MAIETPPIETTPQVNPDALPFGSAARDVEYILTVNAEQFHRIYPEIKFFPMSRNPTQTVVDPLYNEAIRKEFNKMHPILVPVFVAIQPQLKLLKKYGIEEEQDAIAVFNNRIDKELSIDPITGDRIEYQAILFEILTAKHVDYFTNTQVPLNKICTLRNLNEH